MLLVQRDMLCYCIVDLVFYVILFYDILQEIIKILHKKIIKPINLYYSTTMHQIIH